MVRTHTNLIALFSSQTQSVCLSEEKEHKSPMMCLQLFHFKAQKSLCAFSLRSLIYTEYKQHPPTFAVN